MIILRQKNYSISIDLSPIKNIDDRAAIEYLINNPKDKDRTKDWLTGDVDNPDLVRQKKSAMRGHTIFGAAGGGLLGLASGFGIAAESDNPLAILICSILGAGIGTLGGRLIGRLNKYTIEETYKAFMKELEDRPSYKQKLIDEIDVADGLMSPKEFSKKYRS